MTVGPRPCPRFRPAPWRIASRRSGSCFNPDGRRCDHRPQRHPPYGVTDGGRVRPTRMTVGADGANRPFHTSPSSMLRLDASGEQPALPFSRSQMPHCPESRRRITRDARPTPCDAPPATAGEAGRSLRLRWPVSPTSFLALNEAGHSLHLVSRGGGLNLRHLPRAGQRCHGSPFVASDHRCSMIRGRNGRSSRDLPELNLDVLQEGVQKALDAMCPFVDTASNLSPNDVSGRVLARFSIPMAGTSEGLEPQTPCSWIGSSC